ncbi:MAG: phosphoribosylglycinamide formyltransferase [Bacteroidetes bacterium]|nr:phosphoribosylglycinamide formyltransferase [Bacteroidota bacterium]MBP1678211.1 phosphoribosylglycinamide formyltransferase [Bacteroidota bacterium]
MLHLAVLGSGRGSNFQAILRAIDGGRLPSTRVSLVISNNSDAGILALARSAGIPALHVSQKQFPTEEAFTDALLLELQRHGAELIVLAGYMKRVPSRIVREYRGRILNIHPALLPKFGGQGMYGHHVHEAVIAARETESGATVHVVDEEYDRGPIVLQRTIPVSPGETPETLAAKVLDVEHALYPDAIRQYADRVMQHHQT